MCVRNFRANLPLEVVCAREMLRGPTVLYRLISDYLVVMGFSYTPHPPTNRISHGLVTMLYVDDADRILANQSLTSSASRPAQGSHQSSPPTIVASKSIIAHNISSRFKKEERYTGKSEMIFMTQSTTIAIMLKIST